MKTFNMKPQVAQKQRKWYLIDAAERPLGRVASEVARILRGKHKPTFTPHVDTGDHVIVINAGRIALTGRKAEQKFYVHHSGYPGGLKQRSYGELLKTRPEFLVRRAIRGMLPRTVLGRQMLKKLRVYRGAEHPHQAQQPEVWKGREA